MTPIMPMEGAHPGLLIQRNTAHFQAPRSGILIKQWVYNIPLSKLTSDIRTNIIINLLIIELSFTVKEHYIMFTLTELQQQINQAEAKVNELREKLTEQKNNERAQAIASAKELINLHQLTVADLGLARKKTTTRKQPRTAGDKRAAVAPKYQDPSSGKTWTGRGKTPGWMAAYLSAGHGKQDYLIE